MQAADLSSPKHRLWRSAHRSLINRAMDLPDLPIRDVLPALLAALASSGLAVLQAPPGAGKTSVVPLAMLEAGVCDGRIVMLEPRRLAARAAAERMAETLGQKVGATVGYRIRGEARVSKATRIEVVTEGILTRILQDDPAFTGIGAVIFDEFHERSLNADLGLALSWQARTLLRPDLRILVMSATLDVEPVGEMLNAPVITSQGRTFAVETRWLERPVPRTVRFEQAAADLIGTAMRETGGGVLVFLPGEAEIRRVGALLSADLAGDAQVLPLYGALPYGAQQKAIRPLATGRKVVLATAIAETSLTIADIRVVVDCGKARRARFDPGSAMSALVTEPVSRAEADQRRGRAGRTAPGWCYRMWTRGAEGGLAAFAPPEIETGDLTGLALELAAWGAQPGDLVFVTQPAQGALAKARAVLADLGALERSGKITAHGRQMVRVPLHPRLAHMLIRGGKGAAGLAAILSSRDAMRGHGVDLTARASLLSADGPSEVRKEARRLARLIGPAQQLSWAEMAALAYPDRIGKRRAGDRARYVLSGGRGADMADDDALAAAPMIVATDLDGAGREARIRRAVQITETEVRGQFGDQITAVTSCHWSKRDRRVVAHAQEMLGQIALSDGVWAEVPVAAVGAAALDGFRELGLPWSDKARRLQGRVERLRHAGEAMPDLSDAGLMGTLDGWLLAHLNPPPRNASEIRHFDILPALSAILSQDQRDRLDRLAPAEFRAPTGRRVAVDYSGDAPEIAIRLQELFGLRDHPVVAGETLCITLLSPAGRPLQRTIDLPGFWATSYSDVRKDMRGRYPRHPWPQDPASAEPTGRAKPKKR